MSTTLRDFIARREGEIKDQMKALKAELKELQIAKNALGGQELVAPVSSGAPTIKDMARFVLGTMTASAGLTSHEILAGIKEEFGREIDRTSLSPQLSRLKDAGDVTLVGEKWFSRAHWAEVQSAADMYVDEISRVTPSDYKREEDDDSEVPF